MLKRLFIIGVLLLLFLKPSYNQELNCIISLNTSNIQGTNKDIFNTLQNAIRDFMNNTVWTNNVFEMNERIECNMLLNITSEVSSGVYKATLSIQARRPVYGSSYNSVLFNYLDKEVQFRYTEFDPLEFSENVFHSNLTSILAFYAYIVIGLDYDSFSLMGGTPYFQKADKIVYNAQSSGEDGWKASQSKERRNRYWLIYNIMDDGFSPLREFIYKYHRLGLDVLESSMEKGRLVISEALLALETLYNEKPDPSMYFFQVVLDSKNDEIVQIFTDAPQEEKNRIYNLMVKIDAGNMNKYEPLQGQ
jgi:hypothetical protein